MIKRNLLVSLATVLLFFALVAVATAAGIEFSLNLLLVAGAISLLVVVAVASRYALPRQRQPER